MKKLAVVASERDGVRGGGRAFLINGAFGKILAKTKNALVFRGDGGGWPNPVTMVLECGETVEGVCVANLTHKGTMVALTRRL